MISPNGNGNGYHADGGQGELVPSLATPAHRRESLSIIRQAVIGGWNIAPAWRDSLPNICLSIAEDPESNKREKLRAIETLRAMAKDNLDAAIALDKIERLDGGEATERHEHRNIRLEFAE